MFTLRLSATYIDPVTHKFLPTAPAPYAGMEVGKVRLIAGRVNGIEIAVTGTPLSIPDIVALQMPNIVAKSLAQWVDAGLIEVLLGAAPLTASQVLELSYIRNKPATI